MPECHVYRNEGDETVLIRLILKTLEKGWRGRIVVPDDRLRNQYDDQFWTADPAGFIPHGSEDEPFATEQPILLAQSAEQNQNQARILFVLNALPNQPAALFDKGFHRLCCVLSDPETVPEETALAWLEALAAEHPSVDCRYSAKTDAGHWQSKKLPAPPA